MKTILGVQMRAARALLRWSASDLAHHSGVSLSTISRAETVDGETTMTFPNAEAIRRAFESAGVEIIDEEKAGPGARFRQPLPKNVREPKKPQ
jgi:transcriptional regulator with XRE-family HTH domain